MPAEASAVPAPQRKRRRVVKGVLLVAILFAAANAVGYPVRATPAREVKDVLDQWSTTWGDPFGRIDLVAREELTCAGNRTATHAVAPPADRPRLTNWIEPLDVYVGVDLSTAYVVARMGEFPTDEGFTSVSAKRSVTGLELVKENGQWKVCDWGDHVVERDRGTLLGWKFWGTPQ
ncbi:hypothetical protein [Nocardia salmonicida]|uniref:hypothetical protein n=1 Tax=Nocardia salmonicida TaxID=53431 RepID=UPI003CEBEAAA